MVTTIDIRELPTRLDEVLALASAGGEVVLVDGATPRARLVPFAPAPLRAAGLHPGTLQPSPDFDAAASRGFLGRAIMKLLLDTHVFIWWDSDPNRLFAPAWRRSLTRPTRSG